MNIDAVKFRDFRLYLGGNAFALNSVWMQRVTLGWIAWELTNSASFVGLVSFLTYAPAMISGPFFGVLIDRVRVKKAAMVTQSLLLLITLLFLITYELGVLGTIVLAALATLVGVVTSAHNPVRMSLAPRLVERAAIGSVVTLVAINFNLARLTGPALGGALIAVFGVEVSLIVQALFYLPILFVIPRLSPRPRRSENSEKPPFLQEMLAGFRYVMANDIIRRALLVTGIFAFLIRGTLELMPVFADGVFDKGAAGLGLLTSSAGFGALCAGMTKALTSAQASGRLPRPVLVSTFLGISLIPIVGYSTIWELTLVMMVLIGFCGTMAGITMQTAIQLELDDDIRGRVMSLWGMVGIGAAALGAIGLGFLADQFGVSAGLTGAVALGLIALAPVIIRSW
ncbi:MAG: MFS transporter [Marinosulfonomonas sp.]